MSNDELRENYHRAKPLIKALGQDLCDYFRAHRVSPADSVVAMIHVISVTLLALSGGSKDQALTGQARVLDAMREAMSNDLAGLSKKGLFK